MVLRNIKTKFKGMLNKLKNSKYSEIKDEINFNMLLTITFFSGVLLIISSYAWFYATLNVKVDFFKMQVSNNTGLFISLDGVEFTSSVAISRNILINDMTATYPDHTNQWARAGLFAVSSNGLPNPDTSKFAMFTGAGKGKINEEWDDDLEDEYDDCIEDCDNKCEDVEDPYDEIECFNSCAKLCDNSRNFFGTKVPLETRLVNEVRPNPGNVYIAFDFFLKNVSGSPKPDNLYFDTGTSINYSDQLHDDEDGIINSLRIGLVKVGSVPLRSNLTTIQSITCNNNCQMVIFEPNSTIHSDTSILRATKHNITLIDGEYIPTYAVIGEGSGLELANGHEGTGIPLDTAHFAEQNTITEADFVNPIFEIPNAITKMRAYIWIEGQDVDSLETSTTGGMMNIVINLIKDLAGYY